jgi:ubiquinone/menaquinone biosynthesis C-methylase UbiE
MSDQHHLWSSLHVSEYHAGDPSDFAQELIAILPPSSKILELGCGAGNDSIGFAKAGHMVLATDFSKVAMKKNAEFFGQLSNLTFQSLDMSEPMEFTDNTFDVVYARLSLHYFTDAVTRTIFKEIHRILKPSGYLCFICKSPGDPLYGKGKKIEEDMYEERGHVRHFFSEEYAQSLLKGIFQIEKLESGTEVFFARNSAYVKVIARAKK